MVPSPVRSRLSPGHWPRILVYILPSDPPSCCPGLPKQLFFSIWNEPHKKKQLASFVHCPFFLVSLSLTSTAGGRCLSLEVLSLELTDCFRSFFPGLGRLFPPSSLRRSPSPFDGGFPPLSRIFQQFFCDFCLRVIPSLNPLFSHSKFLEPVFKSNVEFRHRRALLLPLVLAHD